MPRIEVADDICLRRPGPIHDDDDDDDDDDDYDDDHRRWRVRNIHATDTRQQM